MTNLIKALHYRYSILIVILITISACATENFSRMYEGPERLDTEIATVLLPSALEVAEVDGYSKRTPYITDGYQPMDFLPGKHVIHIFYTEYWGASTGGSVVVSDIFKFDLTLEVGKKYVFKHNGPTDLINADIDKSVSDVQIWLIQTDTNTKIQATGRVVYGGFVNQAMRSIGTYSAPSEKAGPQNSVEQLQHFWKMADEKQRAAFKSWVYSRSLKGKQSDISTASNNTTTSDTKASLENDAYLQLEYWWKTADDKQRKEFNNWIAKRSLDGKGLY